ncbi:hypothetical protein CARUB_v10013033mg [Capsella rubella]|uniref:RRM domain-containing protein n=1 Tax=Capsella rubella TaxID=81985 RepID=R0I0R7_9BRAS|nr:hypothetical protein CARUB_v10013033mg [Capsella rubella]
MAIGRLLSPKLTPHFNSRGFVPLTRRWLSSSIEDGRKYERLPDSEVSTNKDIGQKGMHWYSFGGLLTNLKHKILGNEVLMDKTLGQDSLKPPMVSSSNVTATKVVTLQNVAEDRNCITSSVKEESSISEMGSQDAFQSVVAVDRNCITSSVKEESSVSETGSQDASQSVAAENKTCLASRVNEESLVSEMGSRDVSQSLAVIETSGMRESLSVNKERLDNIDRVGGLEFTQEKVLSCIQPERVDPPKEPSSKDVALGFLTGEVSESLKSPGENMANLQPEKGHSHQAKPPRNNLSNLFGSSEPYKEVKLPLTFEALCNSNSSKSTGESSCDAKAPEIPGSLVSILVRGGINGQSGDLAAIRERKSIFSFESSRKTVAPLAVTGSDANSLNPNGREEICISKGNPAMQKSCATGEEESKGETLVMKNESLCSQATLAATTMDPKVIKKSLFALSAGEHSPNKVLLRFLQESFNKNDIVEVFSGFGTVLDVQEIPSLEGCIYKDALLTFETKTAVKDALKKVSVMVKNYSVCVEAASQKDMVETICIPDLIGDPDVPIALVKEPARTAKIHPMTHDFSSNQIKEALRFCRSNISKFILGSAGTDAFVEFETEDGKERALAGHSVSICNTQLFISRIDIPRTTVARFSNFSGSAMGDVRALCVPYGKIKQVYHRGKGIADVRFDVSEWPNMLSILNSLNGMEVDGNKLVVRAATAVIPPEILSLLWRDPQGKRYVKSVIRNLVREIEQPIDATSYHTLMQDLLDSFM